MDLEELRLNRLRMAYELGGKPEAIISAANDLMSFVTKGPTAEARASAPEAAVTEESFCEVSAPAAEPGVSDRIAACGTALEMPENGDLAQAEPAVEVKAAEEPESAEAKEAVPSEATAEEAATIAAPTAVVEATDPASVPPPEPQAEATNGGLAGQAATPEVGAAEMAAELVASPSDEVVPSSEEHAPAAAPVTDGSGQEHTAK